MHKDLTNNLRIQILANVKRTDAMECGGWKRSEALRMERCSSVNEASTMRVVKR